MTSGLGCDGESVAMTSATSPRLEDLLGDSILGAPPVVLHNPLLAVEVGDDFMLEKRFDQEPEWRRPGPDLFSGYAKRW
jgi:hypothetical protein